MSLFGEVKEEEFFTFEDKCFIKKPLMTDEAGMTNAIDLATDDEYLFEDDDLVITYKRT